MDLYACVRPIRYFPGVSTPMKQSDLVDMTVFRENTEDIYAGIEYPAGSQEVQKLIHFLQSELGVNKIRVPASSGTKPGKEIHGRNVVVPTRGAVSVLTASAELYLPDLAAPRSIFTAETGSAITCLPIVQLRSMQKRENGCGIFKRSGTTCGTTICPALQRW